MEGFKQTVDICKVNKVKKIVYGKVLIPDKVDLQGDIVSKEDVEETAHNFLMNIQKAYVELSTTGEAKTSASEIGLMHKVFKGIGGFGYVVESFIDQDGCWVLGTKVSDDKIWKLIEDGTITGYSIGGTGTRIPINE